MGNGVMTNYPTWNQFSETQLNQEVGIIDATGDDNDVTLTMSHTGGFAGLGNNGAPGAGTVVDGIVVPQESNDIYYWVDNGQTMMFEFKNLDAGTYNVSVYEGRTTDDNEIGTLWFGAVGDKSGAPNTGDFNGSSFTMEMTIADGDSVFYHSLYEGSGGLSGIIVQQVPEPATLGLLGLAGGAMFFIRRLRV